jgi:transcriptional regulator GlxA family with amidase domain
VLGGTPSEFVETLRLNEAKRRLSIPKKTLDTVAASVGFADAEAFRRAFEGKFGVAPRSYLRHFDSNSAEIRSNGKVTSASA